MTRIVTGILSLIVLTSGCTALNVSRMFKKETVADERHPVVDIMCLWEAAEGTGLNGMPSRGFRGQILFFTAGQTSPAKIDGEIRIFVFDQNGPDGDASKPIHQFDFPGLAWNGFLAQTNFGNAYQLFIPYTKAGNEHADCQLRVRYTPKVGNPVYSRPCSVPLPGTKGSESSVQRRSSTPSNRNGIQQASHEEVVAGSPAARQPPRLLPGLTSENVETIRVGDEARQRTQDRNVQKLRQLAADLASDEPAAPATPPAPPPAATSRKRLNPLAAETAAPTQPEAAAPGASSVASPHPLLD